MTSYMQDCRFQTRRLARNPVESTHGGSPSFPICYFCVLILRYGDRSIRGVPPLGPRRPSACFASRFGARLTDEFQRSKRKSHGQAAFSGGGVAASAE